jgi:hypothetical protein
MDVKDLTADDLNEAFSIVIDSPAKAARRDKGLDAHGVDGACGCCGRKISSSKLVNLAGYKIGPTCNKKIIKIVAAW